MYVEQKISHYKKNATEALKYFNYAVLHTRGLNLVFDIMRYDSAFFARRSDVDLVLRVMADYQSHHMQPFSLLLGKYDYRGKTMPNWTPVRLLSHQEFEEITDPLALYDLGSSFTDLKPPKPLRVRSELEITGTLPYIIETMFLNKAFPNHETNSGEIDRQFHEPNKSFTTQLANFQYDEKNWTLPKTPA